MAMIFREAVRAGRCRRFLMPMLETAYADTPVCGQPVAGPEAGWLGTDYCAACLVRLTMPVVRRTPAARKASYPEG
jgi:hypothetical protein